MKGIVMLDIAKGRRELGWEIGYAAVNGGAAANPVLSVVLNNDADFVVKNFYLQLFGASGAQVWLPKSMTAQVRDSATGNVMFRTPGYPYGLFSPPASMAQVNGRFVSNSLGLPAPYLMRRGSSAFIEISNPLAVGFVGDLYCGFEGFRIYPGQEDPVPDKIPGYALPFTWNGRLNFGPLAPGFQKLTPTFEMAAPGVGHFLLKTASISATGVVNTVTHDGITFTPSADDIFGVQVRDTQQNKEWVHSSVFPAVGEIMPFSFLSKGATSAPWVHPRYMGGQDKIFVDLYCDPASFAANTPGTVEVQLNGVWIA